MADSIDLGEDAGVAQVTIGPVTLGVDVWQTYQRIAGAISSEPEEFNRRVVAVLAGLGFGEVSGFTADRFAGAIIDRVKELKKNHPDPGTPRSQSSTGSTPSP